MDGGDPITDEQIQLASSPQRRTGAGDGGLPHVRALRDGLPLELRDKCVAAGLALGTAVIMAMLGLGVAFLLALAAAAPLFLLRPLRERLFGSDRESVQAYYVAWLYGPLGWGLYRGVRWAQIVGVGVVVTVLFAVM